MMFKNQRPILSLFIGILLILQLMTPFAIKGAALPALVVTEICPDNASYDHYEFFEVYNTTDAAIDLTAQGITMKYTYSATVTTSDVALAYPADTVIPAKTAAVFWLNYKSSTVDSPSKTDDNFKTFHQSRSSSADTSYPLFRVTGQSGMSNDGNRGIRLLQNGIPIASAYYPTGSVSTDKTAHFKVKADMSDTQMTLYKSLAQESPGYVETDQVTVEDTTPPALSDTSASNITSGSAQISFVSDEAGTYYYLVYSASDDAPTAATIKSSGISAAAVAGTNAFGLSSLTPSTDYIIYIAASDAIGNLSVIAQSGFSTLAASPELQLLPAMLITELLPDTSNVNSSDGYEFIEIYNNSTAPIDFSDYKIDYLYPDATHALWPSTPDNVVIAPGKTLVFWIINGANTNLTTNDFNTFFGTNLVEGTDIVKIYSGGMSNSSDRGVSIVTNTNYLISSAYYKPGDGNVSANKGIQYSYNIAAPTTQTLTGLESASPGRINALQVPPELITAINDTTPPAITILQATPTIPTTSDFIVSASVTDDIQLKTVSLYLKNNLDADYTPYNMTMSTENTFSKTISQIDLTEKKYYQYYFTASDGINKSTSPIQKTLIEGTNQDSVRLNLTDGQLISGITPVILGADSYPVNSSLSVAGADVTTQSTETLETSAVFAFEASGVDTFFQNGVLIGEEVQGIFDKSMPDWGTVSFPITASHFQKGTPITISIYAGTKAKPAIDLNENNDNFTVRNIRLILPDGRTLTSAQFTDPSTSIGMGDSSGKHDFVDCTFTLPDNAFTALTYPFDTTALPDGPVSVWGTDNLGNNLSRTVTIDNTPPEIITNAEEKQYKGAFTFEGSATDAIAGIASFTVLLDGSAISLPYTTASTVLTEGTHTLQFTAKDSLGNTSAKTIVFTTPSENPDEPTLIGPPDQTQLPDGNAQLSATVSDPTGDDLTVRFKEGYRFFGNDSAIHGYKGETSYGLSADRSEKTALTQDETESLAATDGMGATQSSDQLLPYTLFDVNIPAFAGGAFIANVKWTGKANSGANVYLYVRNHTTDSWDKVAVTAAPEDQIFTLSADVPAENRVKDGKMTVLVQNGEGYAGTDRMGNTPGTLLNADDTARSSYDFTIAGESDTQYYNENRNIPITTPADINDYQHQLNIHNYVLDNRDRMNIQYLFHTGDIVDEADKSNQWLNADSAYKMLDDANLPYGVLAGNHDVAHQAEDYTQYHQYFNENRYNTRPWYQGSYQNNRGHYDLVSFHGIDFIMLYMGWGIGDAEIAWMNQVLAAYPNRVGILYFHEYILTTGGLGAVPTRIYNEVVTPNQNVQFVFSGHYHDAFVRTDNFDDDHDGTSDRKVYSVLFDFQGLAEGGQGYLRLMHFSLADQKILFRTYSPSLNDYNSDNSSLELKHQEFEVSFAEAGITPTAKTLTTDSIGVKLYTDTTISTQENVASGGTVTAIWNRNAASMPGWYVETTDSYGGLRRSDIWYVTAENQTAVTADDIANTINGLNLSTMEYAISTDGGHIFSGYTSDPLPSLGGSKMVKVRQKASGGNPAGADTLLTFTPNAGDVNGDGLIDVSDVIMAAEIAVGQTIIYTDEQITRANVNDKSRPTVDISDVVLIAERAVGGTTVFPVEAQ